MARRVIAARVAYFATTYGISYGRIAIRDTRRSWGSCSEKGNLNFNYRLQFLPPCLLDYVIVHELCHRLVLSHSAAFWQEVICRLPDALSRAQELRRYERTHGTSLTALRALTVAHHTCPHCVVALETDGSAILMPPQSEGGEGTIR